MTASTRSTLPAVSNWRGIREFLIELATEAGVADPDDFARQWHILMKGSIVSAGEGDLIAARRAQELGRLLVLAKVPLAAG